MFERISKALAAYDAAPKADECAHETTELAGSDYLRCKDCDVLLPKLPQTPAQLEAHFGKAENGELVERLRAEVPAFEKVAKTYERDNSPDPKGAWWRKMVGLLNEAADTLSRAPQSDTVTEEDIAGIIGWSVILKRHAAEAGKAVNTEAEKFVCDQKGWEVLRDQLTQAGDLLEEIGRYFKDHNRAALTTALAVRGK